MSVVLNALSGVIGGFTVEAGGCCQGVVNVPGATVAAMSVDVSPLIFPGDGVTFQAFVSAADTVTVKVCKMTAGLIPETRYNINVLTGDGTGSGLTIETNGTPNGSQALLNLQNGANIAITDDGAGNVSIAATGGGGTVTHTNPLTAELPVFGNGGADVKAGSKTGSTNLVVTATGLPTQGVPLLYDANGNAIVSTPRGNTTHPQLADSTVNPTSGNLTSFDASGNVKDSAALTSKLSQLILTTKGDLLVWSNQPAREPIGGDGTILTADSAQATGMKWAAAAGGGAMVQIAQQVLGAPAATVNFAGIAATFNSLVLMMTVKSDSAVSDDIVYMQVNGDVGANYNWTSFFFNAAGSGPSGVSTVAKPQIAEMGGTANAMPGSWNITLNNYARTTFQKTAIASGGYFFTGSAFTGVQKFWGWQNTAAIASILLGVVSGNNFTTGSVFTLYGIT